LSSFSEITLPQGSRELDSINGKCNENGCFPVISWPLVMMLMLFKEIKTLLSFCGVVADGGTLQVSWKRS